MNERVTFGHFKRTRDPLDAAELRETLALTRDGPFGKMLAQLERFAEEDHSVFLQGERGTGKTHLAPLLHQRSARARLPYVHVNIAALEPGLASSELFGHVPGAFTGATKTRAGLLQSASGGTVLLDEIGKAPISTQRGLLDVLQHRRIRPVGSDRTHPLNVRLLFAANECLDDLVSRGHMTADFVDRLGLFRIRVPSLRERAQDVAALIHVTLEDLAREKSWTADRVPRLTDGLLSCLRAYHWPGNVRELKQLVRRLVSDAGAARVLDERLLVDDLAVYATAESRDEIASGTPSQEEVARKIRECRGNKAKAARELGIGRTTLYRVLQLVGPKGLRPAS